ncbi:hypothetical protein [Pseudactinotalea sp.]|uniref:hypothetical protein n=1 Tax=Pseudactinotalea sp. TaxID=1926260 RepID=UPI003B3B2618
MSDDESLARLRAADPAAGQASDLAALRRAVDARLEDEQPSTVTPPERRDELAARRERRSTRSGWLAGVAAAVIVGVGGYTLGANDTFGGSAGGAADSAYEDSGEAANDEPLSGADGAGGSEEAEIEGGETLSDGDDTMPVGGRVTYEESGLSDETGSAEAFAYDPSGAASAERAAEVADALDVAGDVTETGGAWMVADADGRTVELYDDGTVTFSYVDPTLDPWACSDCDGATPADPVEAARQFLTTIGVDPSGLRFVADETGSGAVGVDAYPEGSAALTWSITVTVDGVYSAWGWLAPLASLGSYDVVSPVTAVERLTDPRFGAQPNGDLAAESMDADASRPGAVPEPGSILPWPVEARTITDAELTLAAYPLGGGTVALLPAWALTADDGSTWTVLAVTEDALDFAAG